ncbi:ABC transporter permease [Mycoplasmopsis fermentans]|nr:ABC transporter permease [Mycoplasmopsis fermentans]VEU67035.1 ABC transporter [Mesomycoplasma conjunctivae]ADN69343.1 putative ABC transporter [Mycoplasmopsis fermentans JER]ADV34964.1 ABC-2 type transporter [Mycoplasmopsis fermentans M64]RMX34719.1 ABC-2 type transporter family protein [Mycoplasmopsis fermentans MF-I1]RMX34784.1 ABC-2 type transporter family protein [Mycoplasmopsis fermentans MF-I2]
MGAIIKRNIKKYFMDKTNVFFSLLSVILVFFIVAVFLGKSISDGLKGWVIEDKSKSAREIMNLWMISTTTTIGCITVSLGASSFMVEDIESKAYKDIYASPVNKSSIIIGNAISIYAVTVIMSTVSFIISFVYALCFGAKFLSFLQIVEVIGLILVSSLIGSSFSFLIVYFIKKHNVFAAINALIGSIAGFIIGGYSTMESLPDALQWIIKCFPASHANVLFRQTLVSPAIDRLISDPTHIEQFKKIMGCFYKFNDYQMQWYVNFIIVAGTSLLLYSIAFGVQFTKKIKN